METDSVFALASTIVAVLLAGPVRTWLAAAKWPLRAPRAAMVLWQSVVLAAVLAAFGAGFAIASVLFLPGPAGRPTIRDGIDRLGWPLWALSVAVFALTVLVGARLAVSILRVAIHTRQRRARHRMLVDLLGTTDDVGETTPGAGDLADELRILEVAQPMAYCLPGIRRRVVLSAGMLASLTETELSAVLSHERAHLRARHDLVLEAFSALYTAFPRILRSARGSGAVQLLVELLADDAAVRVTGPAPLARALVACASASAPAGAMAVGGPNALLRVRRLSGPGNSRTLAATVYIVAAAVLVVPTVVLAVPWLVALYRMFTG